MTVDASESIFSKFKAIAIVVGRLYRWVEFYASKRFRGFIMANRIVLFDDVNTARAFAMVVERRGGDILLLGVGNKLKAFIAKCENSEKVYTDLLVRIFKRRGLAIPNTVWSPTPVAIFARDVWGEFERYELGSVKSYCREVHIFDVEPIRLKDVKYIASLCNVYRSDKRLLDAARKSGASINDLEAMADAISRTFFSPRS
ncbi:MAG: hypothetical protein QW632_02110 [Ignisphaera sp.]